MPKTITVLLASWKDRRPREHNGPEITWDINPRERNGGTGNGCPGTPEHRNGTRDVIVFKDLE